MDKMEAAIEELKHAIEKEPENAQLYTNLGLLYDSQEQYELAVEQYNKALEINPSDRFSLINLAVYYISQGDKINKKALDLDVKQQKEFDKIQNAAKTEWKKAIPLLEKVLEGDDTDELALQNMHAVYFKLKDFKMAKKYEDIRRKLGYIID
jgi:tetratricopeptide (TPR) repeat protein